MYTKILKEFYDEPKNSLDVIFLGDSSIYKAISPMQLWQEHGIASYDYASPTQRVWDSYYCLKEILQYQKPKVIVLDVNEFFDEKPMSKEYKRHLYDNMRFGLPKIQGVTDTIQKNSIKTWFSYAFPITRFHSRWSELNHEDFMSYHDNFQFIFKGYAAIRSAKPYKESSKKAKNKNDKIGPNVTKYLQKIKEETSKNEIELLLVAIPNPKTWNETRKEQVINWSKENNVKFIDLNDIKKAPIDWTTDTEDGGTHLNWKGAYKISKFVGNYLTNQFQLTNHKEDKLYKSWNEKLVDYNNYIETIK